jgi:predicted O-methyltransferase YrrM
LSVHAHTSQLEVARATLRGRRIGAVIVRRATFNVAAAVTAGLSGVILALELGPAERGEYAAVMAWFGVLLMIGEVGKSAAVRFTYAGIALDFPDAGLDFALVDRHYRDYTAKFILPKIKSGGILIIDNVDWYLPSESRAPNSRTRALGPNGKIWTEVAGELAHWRPT